MFESMFVVCVCLFASVLSVHTTPFARDMNMESVSGTFYQQVSDAVLDTIGDSIKTVVAKLNARQDILEETNRNRLNVLQEQITTLLHSISCLNTNAREESFSHLSIDASSENHSVTSTSLDERFLCYECNNSFRSPGDLDSHVKVAHKAQSCMFCSKTCQSLPDLNYHLHKNHGEEILARQSPDSTFSSLSGTPCERGESSSPVLLSEKCGPVALPRSFLGDHEVAHHDISTPSLNQTHEMEYSQQISGISHVLHCNLCSETFSNMMLLNVHIRQRHADEDPAFNSCPCYICGNIYGSWGVLHNHILDHNHSAMSQKEIPEQTIFTQPTSQSITSECYSCAICGLRLQSHELFQHHLQTDHEISEPASCAKCEYIFLNRTELERHVAENHREIELLDHQVPSVSGSVCNTEVDRPDNRITSYVSEHNDELSFFSPIPQVDGNVTPLSLIDSDQDTPKNPVDRQQSGDFQFQYNLSAVNQARRFFENSSREPFSIRYSNLQTIRGQKYPTNVSIDCSSGAYLSAIKPALQRISKGWETEVLSTTISCDEVSERTEMSGRRVCTKLTLFLTETSSPTVQAKVILHFYHTSCTILVQGSSLMSAGITAPVWFVKNFLQPLATIHVTNNSDTITTINSNIRNASYSCGECKGPLNPAATHPKDQELPCSRCGILFHKKCTDRRKATSNWKKSPWYCQNCILGVSSSSTPWQETSDRDTSLQTINTPASLYQDNSLGNTVPQSRHLRQYIEQRSNQNSGQEPGHPHVHYPSEQPHLLPLIQPQQTLNEVLDSEPGHGAEQHPVVPQPGQHAGDPLHSLPVYPSSEQGHESLHNRHVPAPVQEQHQGFGAMDRVPAMPQAHPAHTAAHAQNQPSQPTSGGGAPVHQRFPTTSSRQRSSNVNVENPEAEFQRTAISACRSTIAQQEVELKRLKDGIDIRDKRILQLEAQVGHSADYLAARDTTNTDPSLLQSALRRIDKLESRIETILCPKQQQPSTNIVINASENPYLKQGENVTTQTDCGVCDNLLDGSSDTAAHVDKTHDSISL